MAVTRCKGANRCETPRGQCILPNRSTLILPGNISKNWPVPSDSTERFELANAPLVSGQYDNRLFNPFQGAGWLLGIGFGELAKPNRWCDTRLIVIRTVKCHRCLPRAGTIQQVKKGDISNNRTAGVFAPTRQQQRLRRSDNAPLRRSSGGRWGLGGMQRRRSLINLLQRYLLCSSGWLVLEVIFHMCLDLPASLGFRAGQSDRSIDPSQAQPRARAGADARDGESKEAIPTTATIII
jgi:hypothetical protein